MWDLMLIAATALFFAVAVVYVHGCERLGRKPAPPEPVGDAGARP
jgi:hypothetical protein